MSASLVGSEMCIRDSFAAAPWPHANDDGSGRGETAGGDSCGEASRSTACLLYTSDAADDM
eukprot:10226469-Alexandrium_andersonii.AAC.1